MKLTMRYTERTIKNNAKTIKENAKYNKEVAPNKTSTTTTTPSYSLKDSR